MSLSTQANNMPKSNTTHNAAIKWNDFAAKEYQEHSRPRVNRGPRQQYPNHKQQHSQQQTRRYPYQTQSPQSPPLQQKQSPSLSDAPPPSSPPPPTPPPPQSTTKAQQSPQLQKKEMDSSQSWQSFAAQEESRASPQRTMIFNNDSYSIPRRTSTTPFQSHTHLATPRKSVSESVRKERYNPNNNNNHTQYHYYNNNNHHNHGNASSHSVSSSPRMSSATTTSTAIMPSARYQPTLLDPPLCFCNKPAHERQTLLDGTIYECHFIGNIINNNNNNDNNTKNNNVNHKGAEDKDDENQEEEKSHGHPTNYNKEQQVPVCLFHVHKDFWDVCRRKLHEGRPIDKLDPALSSCPAFNFVFCLILRQQNALSKRTHLIPPNCYCNRPSRIIDNVAQYHHRPFLACQYLESSDHPVRCGYFVFIENARFKPPDSLIHSYPLSSSSQQELDKQHVQSPWNTTSSAYSPTTSYASSSVSDQDGTSHQLKPHSSSSSDFPPSPHESVCSTPTASSFRTITTHNHEEDETIYNPSSLSHKTPEQLVSLLTSAANRRNNCYIQSQPEMEEGVGEEQVRDMGERGQQEVQEARMDEQGDEEGGEGSDGVNITASGDELIRLLQGARMPYWHTPPPPQDEKRATLLALLNQHHTHDNQATTTTSKAGDGASTTSSTSSLSDSSKQNEMSTIRGAYGLLIPGSVYARQALIKKTSRGSHRLEEERNIQELKQKIMAMQDIVGNLEAEKEEHRKQAQREQQKLIDLQTEQEKQAAGTQALIQQAEAMEQEKQKLTDTIQELKQVLQEEIQLRQKSQYRTVELEQMAEDVLKINEELTQEMSEKEEKLNFKDLKCRVCFQENIEYALVPCYHCSYCKTCAEKLTECAICREAKYAIQKIYLS
ncbi:hypothetical protein BDA99DRAFT_223312 [Phascolomyces articulosus]|uniref:RING-type domain-containing protein n=1 Tax=Phascolomyces articulosus TaxID=60185 RepID=A0AAD5P947_9FUNG|nr:hypothetical protein BDA99DRAFT_223312 [Phascolomyces articulosus]